MEIEIRESYYNNGQLEWRWSFLNDVRHGKQENWNKTNNHKTLDFFMKHGRLNGLHQRWHLEKITRHQIKQYKTGLFNGPLITFEY